MIHQKEFHKKGFAFFYTEYDTLEVQKIDFPEEWELDYEYNFKIPKLQDDDEAKKVAKNMGFEFKENSYEVLNYGE